MKDKKQIPSRTSRGLNWEKTHTSYLPRFHCFIRDTPTDKEKLLPYFLVSKQAS